MSGEWTWHGGRLAEARAFFGEGAEPWIDLSTGINPVAWPGAAAIAPDWHPLPDPRQLAALEAAAARHFGVDPAHCCAVPGSEMGLRLLAAILPLPALHFTPAYRTHGAIFPQSRGIADVPASLAEPSALLLANPNNPDGRMVAPAQLLAWLGRMQDAGGWLIVDEAFADAAPGQSVAAMVADDRQLIVMRSFGKYFGLAGLRLGFVLGPARIVAAYRQWLGDWPLSAAALAIGTEAYRDTGWIARTRADLPERAARLDDLLMRHGHRPIGHCPLFRLIEADDAHGLFQHLARHAILTRPFAENPRWLRFGLPSGAAAYERLDRALANG
ncbi:threonine-phosphate decarboxylase CobD [Sphingobium aquiterrae]|uniref:threonine-phosphate decarboxylase CobD n=1 Tax=Sphingobium aquiterrae TaxID=2038656 RepID=UPI003017763A